MSRMRKFSAGRGRGAKRSRVPFKGGFQGNRGGRSVKAFDPSGLVQKAVSREPEQPYEPKHAFADFPIVDELKKNIADKGYVTPTAIQDQAIPVLLENRDVVGIANTGTGKTAAFLIPLVNKILLSRNERALIIAPTRELALQIENELRGFARGTRFRASLCIGGKSIGQQADQLRQNPEFVIGTPGRLIDLEKRRMVNYGTFTAVVLDEVDQMMDMGFIHDMKYIISKFPEKRHSLFFSATVPESVQNVMKVFLTDPVVIRIKSRGAAENVEQEIVRIGNKSKVDLLHDLLNGKEFEKVLVFGRTKHGMQRLSDMLVKRGFRASAIHGNKSQSQRQKALSSFRNNEIQVLLATDVASRGLDIDDVTHVINYDLPQSEEDYVHRIGRTGRADKLGKALTFVE